MSIEPRNQIEFGPFSLDRRGRKLRRSGVAVPVAGRALDVLAVLVAAAGDIVDKETLLDQAWSGLIVDENNVQVQISILRKALGEAWITTIPGRGYRLTPPGAHPRESANLVLPDRPSIVVLPFHNMSGDPNQEYFVDGLVEDITTALSCIGSLVVIARNSAFTYKGRSVDIRQVGRDLGCALCAGRQRPPRA
jgi:DNA-binding winged helix-turn-helix (wHTH) protein